MSADRLESIAARLEAAVSRLESCKGGAAGGAAPAEGGECRSIYTTLSSSLALRSLS